jgi:16S rRNA (cytosine967-C5)-methyltransferase
MNARQLALRILNVYDRQPAHLERTTDVMLREAKLDRRDKRFVFEIVYGVIRRRLTLDYVIDRLLSSERLRKSAALRRILQIGVYQLMYLDRVPAHAAVNESVNMAKSDLATRPLAGVVNGVLRRFIADRRAVARLPGGTTDLAERLSIEYSHPRWMVERWIKNFDLAAAKQLLAFNNERPVLYLRRKIHGVSRQQFNAEIRSLCEPVAAGYGYLKLYFRLKKNVLPENIHPIYQGLCTIQAPSSGWVVALMEAESGERILDLCSSPGGKMALLSELVGETGSVCACDDKRRRIQMCADTVRRLRLTNVHLLVGDGRFPPLRGVFGKVLVDAPCTATGVLQRHPEARWTRKPSDIKALTALQRALLESAARLVGPGGTIVYATCSLEPEENEEQVAAFLQGHPEFVHAGCPSGIPQTFIDSKGFLVITPFLHGLDGMFGARLKRIE